MTTPVSLITGGSSGIGAAVATQLLARGHAVAVTGRSEARLKEYADQQGNPDNLLVLPGDAADHGAVVHAVTTTVDRFGRLDHAIANAGYATHDDLVDGDPAGWRDMVLTNVLGPALLVNAVVPALRETKGRIVMVGSVAGFVFGAGNIYGATKWAITGLAENTRLAVTADGIGVTLIAPGRTETNFWADDGRPEGILLSADQIADSVVWALTQPEGVDVNTVVVRPIGQPR